MSKKTQNFGSRLAAAIAARGLTRQQTAEASGLSLDFLYRLLSGRAAPGAETVVALCRALEVSADELLGLR